MRMRRKKSDDDTTDAILVADALNTLAGKVGCIFFSFARKLFAFFILLVTRVP